MIKINNKISRMGTYLLAILEIKQHTSKKYQWIKEKNHKENFKIFLPWRSSSFGWNVVLYTKRLWV